MFLEILKAILLGIVQGLTEFLPVSSSGHLTLLQMLGVGEPSLFFNVMMHVGTLAASVIVLWKPVINCFKSWEKLFKIAVSCIPTIIIVLIIEMFFEDLLTGAMLGVGFLVTAVVLTLTEVIKKPGTVQEIDYKRALLVGLMQGIAALPGISRSGMTIGFLKGTGVEGKQAAEYSFIIGMPVIAGAALFELLKYDGIGSWSIPAVICGMIASFISGFLAMKLMLKIFAGKSLLPFAGYVLVLAIISFIVL